LCRSIRQRGLVDPIYVQDIEEVGDVLKDVVQGGDIVITQGAGSVGKLVKMLADRRLV
jgi:UDP-N-acetylmuramate--alanine ligase